MPFTKAQEEKLLKRYFTRTMEERGYFVKTSADGTITILQGAVGGKKEILATGLELKEAGRQFGVWGADNPRETREQILDPNKSPDGSGLMTPFYCATLERMRSTPKPSTPAPKTNTDNMEDSDMSNKPSAARMRAKQTIREFQERQNGGDGGYTTAREDQRSTPRQRFAEHMEQQLSHTPADAARDAMIRRQAERPEQPRETYLQSIARKRWDTDCPTGRVIIDED